MFFGLLPAVHMYSYASNSNSFQKPLNAEEEQHYLQEYANGSIEAKNILIERNLRLVAHIAKKYSTVKESEDLISIGTIGLIKAVMTFKALKGTRFATYASKCIDNATPTQRLLWTNMTLKVCLLARNVVCLAPFRAAV